MTKQERITKLAVLSIGHLLVDLCGVFLLGSQLERFDFEYIALFFVLYNVLAFGVQPFFGFYADSTNRHYLLAVVGLLLAVVALLLMPLGVIPIIVTGLGNAMYHVGAGVLAMNLYQGKAAPAGIFVAPGAIGVFLGVILSTQDFNYQYVIALVSVVVVYGIIYLFRNHQREYSFKPIHNEFVLIIALIFIIVFIRGYIGSILVFPWRSDVLFYTFLTISVVIGKFAGGILGDRFGYKQIGIGGLVLSIPFLIAGTSLPVLGMIGAMLFNVTMAITLFLIIDSVGRYKGFAFGITTLSLVITYLIKTLFGGFDFGIWYISILIIIAVLGAYALHIAVDIYDRRDEHVST